MQAFSTLDASGSALYPTSVTRYIGGTNVMSIFYWTGTQRSLPKGFTLNVTCRPTTPSWFRKFTSLVTYEGQPLSAVQNIAVPPIEIEMIDSAYQFDDTNSEVVIVATASSGILHPDGVVAKMERGVARFLLLKFTSKARDSVISFTALQDNIPAQGKKILTGAIALTQRPIPTLWLSLLDDGVSTIKQPMMPVMLENFSSPIPFVTLGLKDSAYQFDLTNLDTSLVVQVIGPSGMATTCSPELPLSAVSGILACPIDKVGMFHFSNLRFTARSAPENIFITFIAYSSSGKSITDGQSIVVGPILLQTRSGTESCASSNDQPIIIAELTISPADVQKTELALRQQIAFLMGVEVTRIIFPILATTKKINGVDVSTGVDEHQVVDVSTVA